MKRVSVTLEKFEEAVDKCPVEEDKAILDKVGKCFLSISVNISPSNIFKFPCHIKTYSK